MNGSWYSTRKLIHVSNFDPWCDLDLTSVYLYMYIHVSCLAQSDWKSKFLLKPSKRDGKNRKLFVKLSSFSAGLLKILSYMVLPCPDPHFHPFNYDTFFWNFYFGGLQHQSHFPIPYNSLLFSGRLLYINFTFPTNPCRDSVPLLLGNSPRIWVLWIDYKRWNIWGDGDFQGMGWDGNNPNFTANFLGRFFLDEKKDTES